MTLITNVIKIKKEYRDARTINLNNPEKYLKSINTLKGCGNTGVSMLAKMRAFDDAKNRKVSLLSTIYRKELRTGKILDVAKRYSKAIKRPVVIEDSETISI